MQIQKIIKYNLSTDSRNLKKNDIFFDFISKENKKNPYLEEIIKKNLKLYFLKVI